MDGVTDAFEGVVGVDEEDGVVGHGVGVGVEGLWLRVEAHDPAVGVGAFDRDTVFHASEDVGSGDASSEVGGATGAHSSVRSLGAAESEFEDGLAFGSIAEAGRFGGNEGLEVNEVEEGGFDELALEKGATNAKDRLIGEGEFAFGEGIDFELPIEVAKVVEVAVAEEGLVVGPGEGGEVAKLFFGEGEVVEEVGGGSGASDDGGLTAKGGAAIEEVEDGLAVGHFVLPVAVSHGELVEVGEKGGCGVHLLDFRKEVGRRRAKPWMRTMARNLRFLRIRNGDHRERMRSFVFWWRADASSSNFETGVGHSLRLLIQSAGILVTPPDAPQSAPAMAAVVSVSPPASMSSVIVFRNSQ